MGGAIGRGGSAIRARIFTPELKPADHFRNTPTYFGAQPDFHRDIQLGEKRAPVLPTGASPTSATEYFRAPWRAVRRSQP